MKKWWTLYWVVLIIAGWLTIGYFLPWESSLKRVDLADGGIVGGLMAGIITSLVFNLGFGNRSLKFRSILGLIVGLSVALITMLVFAVNHETFLGLALGISIIIPFIEFYFGFLFTMFILKKTNQCWP